MWTKLTNCTLVLFLPFSKIPSAQLRKSCVLINSKWNIMIPTLKINRDLPHFRELLVLDMMRNSNCSDDNDFFLASPIIKGDSLQICQRVLWSVNYHLSAHNREDCFVKLTALMVMKGPDDKQVVSVINLETCYSL